MDFTKLKFNIFIQRPVYFRRIYPAQIHICLFILLVCAACSTRQSLDSALVPTAEYLEQNPLRTPDFVTSYSKMSLPYDAYGFPAEFKAVSLIEINEKPFARRGTSADDLDHYLMAHTSIEVDGIEVSRQVFNGLMLICDGLSNDGSQRICWGGPIEIYLMWGNLFQASISQN